MVYPINFKVPDNKFDGGFTICCSLAAKYTPERLTSAIGMFLASEVSAILVMQQPSHAETF